MDKLQTTGTEWGRPWRFKHLHVHTHLRGAILPLMLHSAANLASLREPQILSLRLK